MPLAPFVFYAICIVEREATTRFYARRIAGAVRFHGGFFDPSKTGGTPRKLLDVSKLNRLGWHPRIDLEGGIPLTCKSYLEAHG
jgi:GDP-L-fucose synthase